MIGLNIKIKIMLKTKDQLKNKTFLVYGFGKSGEACFNYLNKKQS